MADDGSAGLVGREKYTSDFPALLTRLGRAGTLWLYGPGGSGKTRLVQLLVEVLQEPPHMFTTIQLDKDSLWRWRTVMDDAELAAALRKARPAGHRFVLFIDGVNSFQEIDACLELLQGWKHSAIITSRLRAHTDEIGQRAVKLQSLPNPALPVPMPLLDKADATALFRQATPVCSGAFQRLLALPLAVESDIVTACWGAPGAILNYAGQCEPKKGGSLTKLLSEHVRLRCEEVRDRAVRLAYPQQFTGTMHQARLNAAAASAAVHWFITGEPERQRMFLDCSSVFLGQSVDSALLFWEALFQRGDVADVFQQLLAAGVVSVCDGGKLQMHAVPRRFGRGILLNEYAQNLNRWAGTHAWLDGTGQLVGQLQGSKHLQAIAMPPSRPGQALVNSWELPGLQVVLGGGLDVRKLQPAQQLLWASMEPSLVTSQLLSSLPKLKVLTITCCSSDDITEVPGAIEQLTSLGRLEISGSQTLAELPYWFRHMHRLRQLKVSDCGAFTTLHNINRLTRLQVLDLSGCKGLLELEQSHHLPPNLEQLNLSGCEAITELDLVGLARLRGVNLGGCGGLSSLHLRTCPSLTSLQGMSAQLQHLCNIELHGCAQLIMLPESVAQLPALTRLVVRKCDWLVSLPSMLGQLLLRELSIFKCGALECLPSSVNQLSALQAMHVKDCSALCASVCFNPQAATLADWQSARLHQITHLSTLEALSLAGFEQAELLPDGIEVLTGLTHLDLSGCSKLRHLPDSVTQLQHLQQLLLSGCTSLICLPHGWEHLTGLTVLQLHHCCRILDASVKTFTMQNTGLWYLGLSGMRWLGNPGFLQPLNALWWLDLSH